MIWLTWKLLTLPIRVVTGTVSLSVKTVLLIGIRRIALVGLGVAVGLLVAPKSGEKLRAELRDKVDELRAGGNTLQQRVTHELANSPRTWHLPQPTVVARDGVVTLTGHAPHESGREELGRIAMSVAGVHSVDNQVEIGE